MSTTTTFNNDVFKAANDVFGKSVQAGVKFQEETARFWNDTTTRAADDFRNRVEKIAEELAPLNKKNADRFQRMFDEQTQRNASFFRAALDANPVLHPVSNPTEWFERTNAFFKAGFETVRESFDAAGKLSQDFVGDVQTFSKRCETTVTQPVDAAKRPAAK